MVALLAYAGAWLAPVAARPALAVLAVSAAAAIGPIGALAVAIGSLAVPVPWSVRAALLVAAAINGVLHAQRRRHSRELVARSFTDRLTGLHNYDYFAEAMRSELARVRRYGGCVTLVMLDLDRFKAFNDHHGHAAGNRLLNAVGQAIAREKRDADIAGVATFPVDARTPQDLFELADRALYEAKRRGRDQVVAVSELIEPPRRL